MTPAQIKALAEKEKAKAEKLIKEQKIVRK